MHMTLFLGDGILTKVQFTLPQNSNNVYIQIPLTFYPMKRKLKHRRVMEPIRNATNLRNKKKGKKKT